MNTNSANGLTCQEYTAADCTGSVYDEQCCACGGGADLETNCGDEICQNYEAALELCPADCGYLPGDSCIENSVTGYFDCSMVCVDAALTGTPGQNNGNYINNGVCDDVNAPNGINVDCSAYGWDFDSPDCVIGNTAGGDPGNTCALDFDISQFGYESCDHAWYELGLTCSSIEENLAAAGWPWYYNCTGCQCPGDNGNTGCNNPSSSGDGYCDDSNNTEACDYDGGDCCESTCTDGPEYQCDGNFVGNPCNFDECFDPSGNNDACGGSTTGGGTDGGDTCSDSEITFSLIDQYNDGFEGTLTFNGTEMTGNTGDTFTFCLSDGDYTYTYSCSEWCTEHQWTISDANGNSIANGFGSNGPEQTLVFTVGGDDVCGDECPDGRYFNGSVCYSCSYCLNTDDDSSCGSDTGNDCCGACGGSATFDCGSDDGADGGEGSCEDLGNANGGLWADTDGDGCLAYVANNWCGLSWQPNYATNGLTGDLACCACGGGTTGDGGSDTGGTTGGTAECDSCLNNYINLGSECCDTAWQEFGLSCSDLEATYGWECTGCNCPGDVPQVCGDGNCTGSETAGTCSEDCVWADTCPEPELLGDGECDWEATPFYGSSFGTANYADCGFDGGDCCPSTNPSLNGSCTELVWGSDAIGMPFFYWQDICLDPDSVDNQPGGQCTEDGDSGGGNGCSNSEWECDNGDCINASYQCDGSDGTNGSPDTGANWDSDCSDGSDETLEICCNLADSVYPDSGICPVEICNDTFDNDFDGYADCDDEDCDGTYGAIDDYCAEDILGDLNQDDLVNVSDVVLLVNIILTDSDEFNSSADLNQDGLVNVSDIVLLVGIILGD